MSELPPLRHLTDLATLPMNTGQARHAPYRTPDCLLSAPPDVRECYRALKNLQPRPYFITARALACVLGWRYARAEAALEALQKKGWVGCDRREGRDVWTATP